MNFDFRSKAIRPKSFTDSARIWYGFVQTRQIVTDQKIRFDPSPALIRGVLV